jgi:hypothetical protein
MSTPLTLFSGPGEQLTFRFSYDTHYLTDTHVDEIAKSLLFILEQIATIQDIHLQLGDFIALSKGLDNAEV